MAGSKLHDLTVGAALVGTEEFYGVRSPYASGDDRRWTAEQIKTFVGAGGGGGSPGGSTGQFQYNNAGFFGAGDLWQGVHVVEQRVGINPQAFRVYNTYTDASNYERLSISWASNICTIGTQNGGTGIMRSILIEGAGGAVDGAYSIALKMATGYMLLQSNSGIDFKNAALVCRIQGNAFEFGTNPLKWHGSGPGWGADVGLVRNAADILEINNGTAGQYRDLIARNVTRTGREIDGFATLTDAATVALDAALGNVFHLTALGNRTIAAPTNKPAATQSQRITIIHKASGANRTLTLTTGSAGSFRLGGITLSATTSGVSDHLTCVYNPVDDRWDVVSVAKGY
jgi:hypothetical protein